MKTASRTLLFTLAFTAVLGFGTSAFAESHMEAAIAHLKAAKAELQQAEANKGGWRIEAMKTIDEAIAQVKTGQMVGRKK